MSQLRAGEDQTIVILSWASLECPLDAQKERAMASPGHRINEVRKRDGIDRAILFIHGFSGGQQDTWGLFPTLIGTDTALSDWDILSLGYSTSLLPDIRGIWSADPDLPILAIHLKTRLEMPPLVRYRSLAIVAHSMGGLVVQRALLDNPALVPRVSHLLLFGTPSNGLRKAGFFAWLMPQVKNMAEGGAFIRTLRKDWSEHFDRNPSFQMFAIAGDRDQFVPPKSSLLPFAPSLQRVVAGDHLSMVKPKDAQAESVCLLIGVLTPQPEPAAASAPLRARALAMTEPQIEQELAARQDKLTQAEVVNAAIKFDLDGKRQQAIDLLERHLDGGTDIKGTLGGRYKRLWLETGDQAHAAHSLELYRGALDVSLAADDHEQVYYHAINVAFLTYVSLDRKDEAAKLARLALEHCAQAPRNLWRVATEAEAQLYLEQPTRALELYREVMRMGGEPWQLQSAGQQAFALARKLGDPALQEELRTLFNPESRRKNRIFVSYSHKNREWLERLQLMMSPFMRKDELVLWDDTRLQPGQKWLDEIRAALGSCKVAVLLVSKEFLASDFIFREELPVILQAAESGAVKLLWVYVSPALYEETGIKDYQAAYDPSRPLAALPAVEQDDALKRIAIGIKAAVFD
jgi:pimeloyl-ACP methyl ester carboxylesterase